MKAELRKSADRVTIITLNGEDDKCDFMTSIEGRNNIYALDFYGGNDFNGDTFKDMCENDSFSRMGVLRMDVDNLGKIFQIGISPERATLSRYATLSRSFDYFFSGYLNQIKKEESPDRSTIIYSGGDDIFLIGSWEDTIKIAKRIHEDFKSFTCENPCFSISGGIAIVQPDFPIMKAAEESAIEEDIAKNHSAEKQTKNSISFMGMPLNWDKEFVQVEKLKNRILELLDKEILNASFINKLMSHYENADFNNHKIGNFKTFWMIAYDFGRMKERNNSDIESSINELMDNCIRETCNNLQRKTLNNNQIYTDYHPLELWTFAARWAELENRKNKNKE